MAPVALGDSSSRMYYQFVPLWSLTILSCLSDTDERYVFPACSESPANQAACTFFCVYDMSYENFETGYCYQGFCECYYSEK